MTSHLYLWRLLLLAAWRDVYFECGHEPDGDPEDGFQEGKVIDVKDIIAVPAGEGDIHLFG